MTARQYMQKFEQLRKEMSSALDDEISAAVREGGSSYVLFNGRHLSQYGDRHLYMFSVDEDLRIPDGSQVILKSDSDEVKGQLLGTEGFTPWLVLSETISLKSDWALTANPFFLLETLRERLDRTVYSPITGDLFIKKQRHTKRAKTYTVKTLVDSLKNEPVVLVWGPPGTGKTQFVAEFSHKLLDQGERILMMSISNIAVDNATTRIQQCCSPRKTPRIVRYGHPRHPDLRDDHTLVAHLIAGSRHPDLVAERKTLVRQRRNLMQSAKINLEAFQEKFERLTGEINTIDELLSEEEREIAKSADVLLTTLAKASLANFIQPPATGEFRAQAYDTVIIDEASIVSLPYMLWSSTLPKKRLVVVGDFRQLPPVVRSSSETAKKYLSTDIFEFLSIPETVDGGQWEPRLHILCEQHRMNPAISQWVSSSVYNGLLKNSHQAIERKTGSYPPDKEHPALIVDTSALQSFCLKDPSKRSHSRFNILHALLDISIAEITGSKNVGIITPYNLQGRLTNRMALELGLGDKIACSTVHRFQGSERQVIVLDTVDSTGMRDAGLLLKGGHDSLAMRLLNVAITRAREKLIIVADKAWLTSRLDLGNILLHAFNTLPAIDASKLITGHPFSFGTMLHGKAFLQDVLQSALLAKQTIRVFADGN